MTKPTDVSEIVKKYLDDNGYDGLFVEEECACTADELMPCSGQCDGCIPGYFQEHTEEEGDEWGWGFVIGHDKPENHKDIRRRVLERGRRLAEKLGLK